MLSSFRKRWRLDVMNTKAQLALFIRKEITAGISLRGALSRSANGNEEV